MSGPNWFNKLFGFNENEMGSGQLFEYNKKNGTLKCSVNNKYYKTGSFSVPKLSDIRESVKESISAVRRSGSGSGSKGTVKVNHIIVNDILAEHCKHPGACFQVASQLNCLEFTSEDCTPEDGITIYACDRTQGPACAIACGAATFIRNYYYNMPKDSRSNQKNNQINTIINLEKILSSRSSPIGPRANTDHKDYWYIKNGYLFSDAYSLKELNERLKDKSLRELLYSNVGVGLGLNSQVTYNARDPWTPLEHEVLVSQIFCSAIPVSYNDRSIPQDLWEPLAKLLLEAQYEATLLLTWLLKESKNSSGSVFLTFLGNGAFGNKPEWIAEAINNSIKKVRDLGLDITINICHYKIINEYYKSVIV
jgi:hypothetical protein